MFKNPKTNTVAEGPPDSRNLDMNAVDDNLGFEKAV